MNKVILIGNLTADPEVNQGSNYNNCKFTIAVNRAFRSQDGQQQTDFFNIVTWGKIAENCGKFLSKGSKVGVSGAIYTRRYTNPEDGITRNFVDINADEVEFLSPRNANQDAGLPDLPEVLNKKNESVDMELPY